MELSLFLGLAAIGGLMVAFGLRVYDTWSEK